MSASVSSLGRRAEIIPTRRELLRRHVCEGSVLGLVGIGLAAPGQLALLGGSFWQLTVTTDRPLIDPQARVRTLCHAVPGQWMTEGIGFYCGIVMRWFRDAFCEVERAEAARRGIDAYAVMEELAAFGEFLLGR